MEIGSKVRCIDSSFGLKVTNDGFKYSRDMVVDREYILLYKDLKLPINNGMLIGVSELNKYNNVIIQDVDSKEIFFSDIKYLREIEEKKKEKQDDLSINFVINISLDKDTNTDEVIKDMSKKIQQLLNPFGYTLI